MSDRMFLDRYFRSIHDKLDADALLYNRKIPHTGLSGSENEQVIGSAIRDFLPPRFGVEVGALVIDRHGNVSKQCDIVIYDAHSFPKYFRKIFPIELIYCVIEVKTLLTSQEAGEAVKNYKSIRNLNSYPALTPYWETKTKSESLKHNPPFTAYLRTELTLIVLKHLQSGFLVSLWLAKVIQKILKSKAY